MDPKFLYLQQAQNFCANLYFQPEELTFNSRLALSKSQSIIVSLRRATRPFRTPLHTAQAVATPGVAAFANLAGHVRHVKVSGGIHDELMEAGRVEAAEVHALVDVGAS